MRAKEESYRILEAALSIASEGVDEAEVGLRGGTSGFARFTDNQVHPAGLVSRERLTVRLSHRGRWARASTADLSADGISEAAQRVRAELERLPEGVIGDGLPAPQSYRDVDAYDEATADLGTLEQVASVARAVTAAYRSDHPVQASGAFTVTRGALEGTQPEVYALANTRGLLAYHPSTRAEFEVYFTSGGRSGRARASHRSAAAIDTLGVVERALWSATHGGSAEHGEDYGELRPLPPGRYPAVLDRPAVARLLKVLGDTAGLARARRGASFLADRDSSTPLDPRVSIVDDFAHPLHTGVPFDCDGVARRNVVLVDEGALREPVVSWSSSLQFEEPPTGHGCLRRLGGSDDEAAKHLVMGGGHGDVDRLADVVRTGLFISDFEDLVCLDARELRVAGVTAHGTFAIEGGEVSVPVAPMRFEVSVLALLRTLLDFGSADWAEGVVAPPLAVPELPVYAWA